MSRSSNSLRTSDVITTPIKLKYSASYSSADLCNSGISVLDGVNGPVTITGSIPQDTLNYLSVRHLYYSNFLTGSYLTTTSSLDNSLQSTAASGTLDADVRLFPTQSGATVRILSIPRAVYGQQISRRSFQITSSAYNIVDDGNGNIIDLNSGSINVGNIIYPQGMVIITNPDYQNMFPYGPKAFNDSASFLDSFTPKTVNILANDTSGTGTLVPGSVVLSGGDVALFTNNLDGTVTLTTTTPGLYTTYYTVQSAITGSCNYTSNTASISITVTATPTTTSTTTSTTTVTPTTTSTTTVPPTTTTTSTTTTPTTTSTTTSTTTVPPTTTSTTTTPPTTTSTTTSTTTVPPTTTSTTTSTTTVAYFYYTIRKYDCNNSCAYVSPDLVGRSSTALSTIDGLYYRVGSFTYQVQTQVSGPTFDVDLDGAPTDADCTTACGLTTTTTSTSTTTVPPTTTSTTTSTTTVAVTTTSTTTSTTTAPAPVTTTTTEPTTTSTTTSTTTEPATTTSTTTSTTTVPPTTTSTTTSTTTVGGFDYFLADEWTCLYPGCNASTTGVSVKLPSGTYNLLDWFATDPLSGVVYQLQSVSSFDAGAVLLQSGAYSSCNLACVI